MNKRILKIGLVFNWLAMAVLLMHAIIPHHHHNSNAPFVHCSHEETLKNADTGQHDEHHACFQCQVEDEWNLNDSNISTTLAILPANNVTCYLPVSEVLSNFSHTESELVSSQPIFLRGPPQA